MKFVCWFLSVLLDILSALIIAWQERRRGFWGYTWYEFRARRGIIPYNEGRWRKLEESNPKPL
jgi:hypothetical protein